MDYIEAEIEVTRNANNEQFLKMIEDMEKSIQNFDKEKEMILEEMQSLKIDHERVKERNKLLV